MPSSARLALFYVAALDDVRWPAAVAAVEEAGCDGNALIVGEGVDDVRIYVARSLTRESTRDKVREHFDVYQAPDEGMPRLGRLSHGQPARVRDVYA